MPDAVFVCGDPNRVKDIAAFLDAPAEVARSREYVSYRGSLNGTETLVVSHGVGAAGAAICFQELIQLGAKTIVRLGTAGAFADDCRTGDVFIPTGAFRLDGASRALIQPEYPAVPDFALACAIHAALRRREARVRCSLVATSDLFYESAEQFKRFKRLNVEAVDMETSALFVIGLLNKVRTASVLFIDGNPLRWKEGQYDPQGHALKRAMAQAIPCVLDAVLRPHNDARWS